jgi:hypothetical protein
LKGTVDIGCCLDQIYTAIFIGKDVTGSLHEQFEVLCGLEQMREEDAVT